MNRLARKGLVSAMVAGGVLASAGYAQADAAAEGDATGSPGVLSGNSVQVPVHVPVNVCGNTISVVGLLNPALGNTCANTSSSGASDISAARTGSARPARHAGASADESAASRAAGSRSGGGAHAAGATRDSAGVLAGNGLRLPLDLPLNLSGNSVNAVGIGNASSGNTAVNGGTPPAPPAHLPIPAPPASAPAQVSPAEDTPGAPELAHTGAGGVGPAAAGSVALLLGGTVLYRRARAAAGR